MAEDFPGKLCIHHRESGTYLAMAKRPGRNWAAAGFKRLHHEEALRDLVTWLKRRGYEWREVWEFFR